jgi:hypothetical protein
VPTTTVKFIEFVVGTKTQPVKSRKIHVRDPCIICSSVEHRSRECPKKTKVQNMFITNLVNFNATIASKPPTIDNMLVNVVVTVSTCSQ